MYIFYLLYYTEIDDNWGIGTLICMNFEDLNTILSARGQCVNIGNRNGL
jgi:hypothetical protein